MEVKRAFRKYLGPDDPGPFMDMINSMSFGCRHMKEYNRHGVFTLTRKTANGEVRVMRVNDVDYIWTEGGKGFIFIILIPDLITGWKIPVTLAKDDYSFMAMADLEDLKDKILRYEFQKDPDATPRFEYAPYIFEHSDTHHTSVGYHGDMSSLNPYYDWHYKHYILDCTSDAGSDDLWRPPFQFTYYGFGEDLHPTWYSMYQLTAHGYHYCFEAAIDQLKRIYQPYNIEVNLNSEEITIPTLTLISRDVLKYNFKYPAQASRFYGKNAFTYIKNSNDVYELTSFGESIVIGGAETATVPEGIDPILFFWPWIPYMDEVRSFSILAYSADVNNDNPLAGKWFVTPVIGSLSSWKIGYYNALGQYASQDLFKDEATFSDVVYSTTGDTVNAEAPCACGNCGTGTITVTNTQTNTPYNSSGTKYVPIGLIGGKIPISMKTTWSSNGAGPTWNDVSVQTIEGTYPYLTLIDPGGETSIVDLYNSCCISSFSSTGTTSKTYKETASNNLSISQELKVGDDVIFTGDSSMSYSMAYNITEGYNGTVEAVVTPPDYEPPVCAGHINFTTQSMDIDQQQTISWSDTTALPEVPVPCTDDANARVFRWSLSGGGELSSTTSQSTTYTAPHTNPNCSNNATISLYCNDVLLDTLSIGIMAYKGTEYAYTFKWAIAKGTKCNGTCSPGSGQYAAWHVACNRIRCNGENAFCYEPNSMCTDTPDACTKGCWYSSDNWCGGLYWNVTHDIRTQELINKGCCPGGI